MTADTDSDGGSIGPSESEPFNASFQPGGPEYRDILLSFLVGAERESITEGPGMVGFQIEGPMGNLSMQLAPDRARRLASELSAAARDAEMYGERDA